MWGPPPPLSGSVHACGPPLTPSAQERQTIDDRRTDRPTNYYWQGGFKRSYFLLTNHGQLPPQEEMFSNTCFD